MKKKILLTSAFSLIFISVFSFLIVKISLAADFVFERTLVAGMSGEDVRQLQIILNADPKTKVNIAGPGSPGNETSYFGSLTKLAVIKFQEIHGEEILKPNFLTNGTGIVGPATRKYINVLKAPQISALPKDVKPNQAVINPNLKNFDRFLSDIDKVSAKKGLSTETLAKIKAQMAKDIEATTTDLRQAFLKIVEDNSISILPKNSPIKAEASRFMRFITKMLSPNKAQAQSSDQPFGGQLYYSYYCTCSENWLIDIQPLAPNYVVLLTYMTGTQAYLSYNIPETQYLLGKYRSGQATCSIYIGEGCVDYNAEGDITPTVGSNL